MLKRDLSKSYLSECNLIKYGKIEADDVFRLIGLSTSSDSFVQYIIWYFIQLNQLMELYVAMY